MVVTICGSMKFKKEMPKIAFELEADKGYVVLQCVFTDTEPTEEQLLNLGDCHFKKIDISDAIYVVNIGGYIGSQTSKEIEYAKAHGKEVIYHEKIV